jgi:hypothetical protein
MGKNLLPWLTVNQNPTQKAKYVNLKTLAAIVTENYGVGAPEKTPIAHCYLH